jgi:hypothetical protein
VVAEALEPTETVLGSLLVRHSAWRAVTEARCGAAHHGPRRGATKIYNMRKAKDRDDTIPGEFYPGTYHLKWGHLLSPRPCLDGGSICRKMCHMGDVLACFPTILYPLLRNAGWRGHEPFSFHPTAEKVMGMSKAGNT